MKFSFIFVILGFSIAASSSNRLSDREEFVDFKNIQQVLKNDRLDVEVKKEKSKREKKKRKKLRRQIRKYQIPREQEFWTFFSEYWMVKNATILKWDFKKPDYGVESAFRIFLETLGIYEKRFKILFTNTPDITHFALPSDNGETIFLLSIPFIRTLDLSKLEISLLLLEDFLRAKQGYFKNFVRSAKLDKFLGGNFFGKKLEKNFLKKTSEKYDQIIFDRGFNFQQQFEVTTKMNSILKSDPKLWNAYYQMIGKIDNLVKSNILYKKYLKIYPSPELQLSWLKPKKGKIL